jgi:glycine/D-amino acid oxidase-like deaminating enzyme/nitrite reductase/ring-hydroxylating ferredoxin subunit
MPALETTSLWEGTSSRTHYPPLEAGRSTADVVVIGGGITGLTAAYLLVQAGRRVVVLERRRLATGTTGRTTAKVTSLHGLKYATLADRFDDDVARVYGAANQAGVEEVARIGAAEGIDCDLRRMDAFTYTESDAKVAEVEHEVEVAQRLGLPATLERDLDLPYPTAAAVRFSNQLLFHPRRYCLGLGAAIVRGGGRIHEQTEAKTINERDGGFVVGTAAGAEIEAHQVIQATLLPFNDPALLFAKTSPSRSYALAGRIDGDPPNGMFLGIDEPGRSVRPHWVDGQTYLVVEGESHKTGQDSDAAGHFGTLEAWANDRVALARVDYRWSAQDFMAADGIPYIGRLVAGSDGMLGAAGFGKWGMSNGTAAAMMLTDIVLGRDNPWLDVFDPQRLNPGQSLAELTKQNADVVKQFVGGRVGPTPEIEQLAPGTGAVVDAGGKRVAAYRQDDGQVITLSARCTHLGCLVAFNSAERSWDCPCHGSRFDVDGSVLEGPALKPLAPEPIGR